VSRWLGWAYLHVVDLVRDAMVDNMRRVDQSVPAAAVIFIGGGFAAAAVRAIGTSLLLVGIRHVCAHASQLGPGFPDIRLKPWHPLVTRTGKEDHAYSPSDSVARRFSARGND